MGPSRALQARARADLVRKVGGSTQASALKPVESPAVTRQRSRAQRAQGAELAPVSKVFGTAVPADIAAAEVASGMDSTTPFSPGAPLSPYDGFSRTPRSRNFVPQYNASARPRSNERVSFDTLRGLIESYDFAQICIWHRIDSLRALEWSLVAADGHEGDVSDAVAAGMAVLKKPDRKTPFDAWLAKFAYDILAFDAGALWRMRNRAGQVVGIKTVDGTTLAPLLDDWGDTPEDGAPAFVQYVNGLPWNWLTTDDLIYQPFRQRTNTIYGTAPLESILLNANTDLRFQAYFLQRFTEGNLPAAFASAPSEWTPQQIEQFQEYWDGFILGDQSFKSQVRWIPPGSKIEWSNEKDFTDAFSLFMMRKTASAYHVVPADLGFTENVNKSSGETQSDVQHRVGDVPLAKHIASILTAFLQDDLHLPVKFLYDFGEEQDDRYQTAQADDLYIKNGTVSNSDIRELRFGLSEPDGKRTPRFIYSNRSGPVPLSALEAVAGPIDPESGAPEPGAPLPHTVFQPVEGVEGNPPTPRPPLAVEQYGPGALPVAAPQSVPALPPAPVQAALTPALVAKDGDGGGAPTAGITSATGITSYDLVGHHQGNEDDDETPAPRMTVTKGAEARAAELAAFRTFLKGRRRDGRWRDFTFTAIDPVKAHRLNDTGRLAVRKAVGQVAVAGLAVLAADTGRVLMLQRALDEDDPASGTWEMPGGHIEGDETPLEGAAREWAEETGCTPPAGIQVATWTSPDGIYQGIVWLIGREADVPVFDGRDQVTNPDDPDGDKIEAIAWWNPSQLPDNPAVRPELLDSIDAVMDALGRVTVVKATGGDPSGPKADASAKEASSRWPGWDHDEATAEHWARKLTDGYTAALSRAHAERIASSFLAAHPADGAKRTKAETAALAAALTAAALAHLEDQGLDLTGPAAATLQGLYADAYLIGAASGNAVIDGGKPTLTGWKPGDTDQAHHLIEALALGTGLAALLMRAPETAAAMSNTRMAALAAALATGAASGQSAAIIAGSLIAVLGAAWRSLTAAVSEVTSGSSAGASDTYQRRDVTLVRWALDPSSKSCPVCIGNANAQPRALGRTWPSGDANPPIHGRCRCSLIPA
jgi:8-oxo-dGTP pyrophosphatase MutT (NUDIX family)